MNDIKNLFAHTHRGVCLALVTALTVLCAAGCQTTDNHHHKKFRFEESGNTEAEWIRNGEPIKFEGALWFPADDVESFLDAEMRLMGEQNGVQFFVDKVDVRPFNRLYTKFDKNKFRFFEKRPGL